MLYAQALLWFLAGGLLWRLYRENRRLESNERLSRKYIQIAVEQRERLLEELRESHAQKYEMQLELDSYRETEKTREEFRRIFRKAMAN